MLFTFLDCGDFAQVGVDTARIVLTDDQITRTWCQIADLYDSNHSGPATIIMGNYTTTLSEEQWHFLYEQTSGFIEKEFRVDMLEEKTYH